MDTTKNTQRVLSLCSGVRGIERGVERALEGIGQKLDTVAYVEIEAFIIANLIAGMEAGILDSRPIWANLKTCPWEIFHGKIHGITGGYPCQPFSMAGKRAGVEDPRHLWPYIAKGIGAIKPFWCFFENVPGHLTLGYDIVRRELQEMGYHVEEGIFSAEEFGATHRRERLFILAVLGNSEGLYAQGCEGRQRERKSWRAGNESEKLGNTYSSPAEHEIQARRTVFAFSSEELANSRKQGYEGSKFGRTFCKQRTSSLITASEYGKVDQWPARPGEQQYDWEEPRIIKSGMGCTINGYNFREDLLRALGNGVVEQTAEIAWNTLWVKQLNYSYRR